MYYLSDKVNSIVSRKWPALKTNFWVLPGNHTCNQLSCLFCTSERQQLALSPGATNQYHTQLLALPYRKMTWLRWNLKAQDQGGNLGLTLSCNVTVFNMLSSGRHKSFAQKKFAWLRGLAIDSSLFYHIISELCDSHPKIITTILFKYYSAGVIITCFSDLSSWTSLLL